MKTVATAYGSINLHSPPTAVLSAIGSWLPLGVVRYAPPVNGADYGLVMQRGHRELHALKQQPADCDRESGLTRFQMNTLLIAYTLAAHRTQEGSGLFLPCPYIREKGVDVVESGIAYFSYPYDLEGPDGLVVSPRILAFVKGLAQSSTDIGIPLQQIIGFESRPRLQLGSLGFGFMTVDAHLVCLKTVISEADPVWGLMRATGVADVLHLPSVPAAIEDREAPAAKPEAS
jgi:hypothetical protein